jgi:PPOX class probable F420-dependent enzyme
MLDLATPRGRHIDGRLRDDLIIWLTTVRPDSRPHTVPVWFWWDGETVTIFGQPGTTKVRNLQANPHVTLALETRDEGEEVIVLEGPAELLEQTSDLVMRPEFAAKYARLFPRIDSSPERMAAEYRQPIRITPVKLLAWGMPE